ncbi:hypothetical protein ACFV6G_37690 [Streptomyces lavendulae]|uniref:hypothetical protein n=1 Tax=Streptomyces lavendulae TaxID=1914 RepID=UPI0036B460D8
MPQQGEPQEPQTPEQDQADKTKPEPRGNFSARVRVSVRKRAKVYAAGHDINLQDLVDAALDEYLARRNA